MVGFDFFFFFVEVDFYLLTVSVATTSRDVSFSFLPLASLALFSREPVYLLRDTEPAPCAGAVPLVAPRGGGLRPGRGLEESSLSMLASFLLF